MQGENDDEALKAKMLDLNYWRNLVPWLHVGTKAWMPSTLLCEDMQSVGREAREYLVSHGFARVAADETDMNWTANVDNIRRGVLEIVKHGWEASFIMVYDEPWAVIQQVLPLVAECCPANQMNMDMYAWRIDPGCGGSGWPMHRDRPGLSCEDVPASFRADGTPKYNTVWIPLSDATLDNSCLHMVPAEHDPCYKVDDYDLEQRVVQAVHASEIPVVPLPSKAGSVILFSHRTLHWGSPCTGKSTQPRVAMSFACSDPTFEIPYCKNAFDVLKDPTVRVSLVCGNQIMYAINTNLPAERQQLFAKVFGRNMHRFHPSFIVRICGASAVRSAFGTDVGAR